MSQECVVDDQRSGTGDDITVGNKVMDIVARYIRRYITLKDNPASKLSRRLWGVWAHGFASQYNFLQGLTGLPGHGLEGEADGHDLIRFLSQNCKLVPEPAVAQASAAVRRKRRSNPPLQRSPQRECKLLRRTTVSQSYPRT